MDAIETLFDPSAADGELIPELRTIYGGDLALAPAPDGRPLIFANFVTTLDGVISFNLPGRDTGNVVSGGSEPDHALMGMLRSLADAVVWGAGTYAASRRYVPTPGAIWPPGAARFAAQRAHLGLAPAPLAVIVSRSGNLATDGAVFQRADQPAVVATTAAGAAKLAALRDAPATTVRALPDVTPAAIAADLRASFGARRVLLEGGATLFGQFLAAGLVDELFLTIAPQIAGRDDASPRPGLVAGHAFLPAAAPWLELLALKRAGSVLFTRYRRVP